MPDNPTPTPGPFDVNSIHQLVRLMKRYDLTSIDLAEGGSKIRLRRRGPEPAVAPAAAYQGAGPVAASQPATATAPPTPAAATPASNNDVVIESPMVGTLYLSPAPDSPLFITVGADVRPDLTVCVIEAMKVFTDIPAGLSGTVTEVLVKNGQSVEFGQPMFRVRPA